MVLPSIENKPSVKEALGSMEAMNELGDIGSFRTLKREGIDASADAAADAVSRVESIVSGSAALSVPRADSNVVASAAEPTNDASDASSAARAAKAGGITVPTAFGALAASCLG